MNQWMDEIRAVIKGEKKLSKSYAWMVFLCGLLIFVICMPTRQSSSNILQTQKETKEEYDTEKSAKEKELAEFLSTIEGVGECKVLLCMEKSADGVFREEEKITGVLVAASGAKNGVIKAMIVESVMALYGLEANKVQVFPIKN